MGYVQWTSANKLHILKDKEGLITSVDQNVKEQS